MDDFAQSREPDDLFADEFEPVDEPQSTITPTGEKPLPVKPVSGSSQQQQGGQGGVRGGQNQRGGRGGRGRGRGDFQPRGGHSSTPQVPQPEPTAQPASIPAPEEKEDVPEPVQSPEIAEAPAAAATVPAEPPRITSVRGDRSATGPAKPTKRTEAELTELMSSMRLKNAAKTEAHQRAEADQASYLQREQQAAAKRLEERKAIREQDMERAKNRERKIKAQGVREWDSEKVESDIVDRSRGNSSGYMRGAHGGVASSPRGEGLGASKYGGDDEEPAYGRRGRGRGDFTPRGRGARGGRGGRGRGGHSEGNFVTTTLPLDSDFPSLSGSTDPAPSKAKPVWKADAPKSIDLPKQGLGNSNWAEEMETPVEEAKEKS